MADKPMEILDVHIPCQTCGKLIPAGGNSNCLTCRVWQLRLKEIMPRWIPVTERLPDEPGYFLVVVKEKYAFDKDYSYDTDVAQYRWDGGYIDGCWDTFVDWDEGQPYLHVTHWMPLPEPPKEVSHTF